MSAKLARRIDRIKSMIEKLSVEHKGKETAVYNYFAGYELGYLKGKLAVLEELQEEVV
jgi:hypothetical protein